MRGFVLQHRRRVRGDDAGQVGVGLRAATRRAENPRPLSSRSTRRPDARPWTSVFLLGVETFGHQLQRAEELRPRREIGPAARQLEAVPRLPIGLLGDLLQLLGTLAARVARSSAATPFRPAAFRRALRRPAPAATRLEWSLRRRRRWKPAVPASRRPASHRAQHVRPPAPAPKSTAAISPQAKSAEYDPSFFRDQIRYSLQSARRSV